MAGAAAATSVLIPAELAIGSVRRHGPQRLGPIFHRALSRSLGIRVHAHGQRARGRSVLFVANHLSWSDIPVLGSKVAGSFVAKSDVGGMGPVAFFANLQRTIYVERGSRLQVGEQRAEMARRLATGDNLILFPEGTSNDGVRPLPFKSSLFSVVEDPTCEHVRVQPVTIAYTRLNGMPMTRAHLPDIAWTGDMELGPHVFNFMRLGRVTAEIMFHDPVRLRDFPDRKALARHCQQVVADGYAKLMRGQV